MDVSYEEFCFADPDYYDTPARWNTPESPFSLSDREPPEGWRTLARGSWLGWHPADVDVPSQGWKVHVSARLEDAEQVLTVVSGYCVANGIAFKFLPSRTTLVARNTKYADRSGSGKFITIYPVDDTALERTLRQLAAALDGYNGPYVLSDLRWEQSPLYVRYGGFLERHCWTETGERVLAIERPDGELVPDPRRPVFEVPEWAPVPPFLAPHILARGVETAPADFPFQIRQVLHFSNAGGIYLATDTRSGGQVVLKEARPYAGLDQDGVDAVTRLGREARYLKRLSDLDVIPEFHEHITCWEHHFVVQEYVPGETLHRTVVQQYPNIYPEHATMGAAEYTAWALGIIEQVDAGIRAIHERGVVFGDLHPKNILVRPDGRIAFLDFELATDVGSGTRPALGAPGFAAPLSREGAAIDLYALGCIKLAMFCPVTILMHRDIEIARTLLDEIEERFPVPDTFRQEVLADLGLPADGTEGAPERSNLIAWAGAGDERAWDEVRAAIVREVRASATPEREDRLFPGDPSQFTYNGLGMAVGAAGVLYALSAAGAGEQPEYVEWLLRGVQRDPDPRPGFYDGLHGVAYALDELGRRDDALAVLDRAMAAQEGIRATEMFCGLSGMGLNLLHFAARTGDSALGEAAVRTGQRVADLLARPAGTVREQATVADLVHHADVGLMHGHSGPALLFVRLYERTGEQAWLDLAAAELRRDLDQCTDGSDGLVQVEQGWRQVPYVQIGSAGIGMALVAYLTHRVDGEFDKALRGIRNAAAADIVVNPGLLNGRAGLMGLLVQLRAWRPDEELDRFIARHLRWLDTYGITHNRQLRFPGDRLLRLSTDLASGAAGILLAIERARHGRVPLPFLDPQERDTPPAGVVDTPVDERR